MAKKGKGEVVATVREWEPQHDESLTKIQHAVDTLGRAPGEPAPVPRDHAAIAAAVDRLTKRVKTRKVIVKETVTEYVDAEGPVEVHAASKSHAVDAATAPTTPVAEGKKGGFFSRFKKGKGEAATAATGTTAAAAPASAAPTPEATPTRAVTQVAPGDAWDPSTIPAVAAPKPLQSKAAKRTAGKKKPSKKR